MRADARADMTASMWLFNSWFLLPAAEEGVKKGVKVEHLFAHFKSALVEFTINVPLKARAV